MDIHGGQIQGARNNQEDSLAWDAVAGGMLTVVADGLGGHPGGEIASSEAVRSFMHSARLAAADTRTGPLDWLDASLRATNQRLQQVEREQPALRGLGTTLSALYFTDKALYRISIGDSLIYRLRGDALELVNKIHGNGHLVSSCLGCAFHDIDLADMGPPFAQDERYLIASDGIETLTVEHITALLMDNNSAVSVVKTLLNAAGEADHPFQDNMTVIAICNR